MLELSVIVNKLLAEVPEPKVNVLVAALPIFKDKSALGAVSAFQAVAAEPEQALKVGTPPFVSTKQRVPVAPAEVDVKALALSP